MATTRIRTWFPFTVGDEPTLLGGGSDTRLFIPTFAETARAATLREYTVQRILLNILIVATTGFSTMAMGVRFDNVDVPIGTIEPENDMTSDWLWLEHMCHLAGETPLNFSRDIRAQRKSRGLDEELYFYARNKDAGDSMSIHMSGRILVLLR